MTEIILYIAAMAVLAISLGALSQWAVKYWEDEE